ncbi:MAG: ABC transporter substrate-binding protein [Clostridiales bacterium]|nr:ABC transporter substrate-binding protein [Clostridiales bacterium]
MKIKTLSRLMAIILSVVMIFGLAGCGSSSTTNNTGESTANTAAATVAATNATEGTGHILANGRYDKLVVAAEVDPQDLEPDAVNENPRFYYIYNIYEALFDMADDGSGQLVPCLAEGYEVVNPTTWKVTLHKDIKDWDGNNITTKDVKYSFDYLIKSGNAIRFDMFDSIEIVDDYTFNFHWKMEPPSVHDLEFPLSRALIFSQTAYEKNGSFAKTPVGTGCYTVKELVTGSKLVLEANDNYWGLPYIDKMAGRHKANVQTLEFDVVSEASTAVVGLETDKLNVCGYVPLSMQEEFATGKYADKYTVEKIVQGDWWFLAPNCETLDQNLRLAIFYAIDNSSVAKAMGGSYVPMTTFGNSAYRDYDPSLENPDSYISKYDVEKAKEYLAKSSYKGQTITMVTDTSEAGKTATQMIQTLLLQIGIKSEIMPMTQDNYTSVTTHGSGGKWDIIVKTIGGPSIVGSWHLLFDNEVQNGFTTSFVKDDKLQELYKAASADATHDAAHMKACMDYVLQNGYMYALVGQSSALIYPKAITQMYKREGYYWPSAATFAGK